jgi:agmatinase
MTFEERLARLRDKYREGGAADIHDPVFKRVADTVFDPSGRRVKPYSGVSTFLDAPYRPAPVEGTAFGDLEVALIGVPMDLGVTNRPGARYGPRAVRQMERIGPYHHVFKSAPVNERKVADVGDVPFRSRYSLDDSIADIEAFYLRLREAGVRPLSVGGDHSITYPILKALAGDKPLGLIHFDAHCDTGGPFEGQKFHHGGPFRQAVLAGALDPERTIQIGIRGSAEYLWEFSYDSGMTVIHIEDFHRMGIDGVIAKAREVVGGGPVYISLDVDGIDPAYTPGTGTPEVGGLSPREVQFVLHGLAGLDLVGGDVVEVAPEYDATTNTVQVAAQILFDILCLMTAKT